MFAALGSALASMLGSAGTAAAEAAPAVAEGAGTSAALGAEAGAAAGAEAAGAESSLLGSLGGKAASLFGSLGGQQKKKTKVGEEGEEEAQGGEAKSGIAKLGDTLGSLYGKQAASGSDTYSSPEIPQMSASPFEQSDWHSRTPFAPTSGRSLK